MRITIPINFENTIFYTISCKSESIKDIYVGTTIDFNNRKGVHKNHSQNKKTKLYDTINANGGWDNWEMKEIERVHYKTKQEVLERECYWFETLNATLNTNKPSRSPKERQQDNKDKLNAYMRAYNKKKRIIKLLNQMLRKRLIINGFN
jgi:type II secretory pathway component PulJ